jgi:hypothetical protein
MQIWIVRFYPERIDLFQQAESYQTAWRRITNPEADLEVFLDQKLFGWPLAKRASLLMPRMRWAVTRSLDKAMFQIESRNGHSGLN